MAADTTPSGQILTSPDSTVVLSSPFTQQQTYSDVYQDILQQSKSEIRASIVEFLSNMRWGKTKRKTTKEVVINGKKNKIMGTETVDGWVSNSQDGSTLPSLMRFEHALEVANFVADQTGASFSTTYYDPNVNTLNIAAEIAMIASHELDNPRYNFDGNENDSAAFAMKVVSTVHSLLNRSLGGFMLKQMGTTTQNIYRHDIKEGQDFVKMKEGNLERLFGKRQIQSRNGNYD